MPKDRELQRAVLAELGWDPSVTASRLGVGANDGVVTLTGKVESYAQKHAAELAARVPSAAEKLQYDMPTDRIIVSLEQELARIRAACLRVDTATYATMLQRLEPSTAPQATFRHTARELLALSAWRANDTTATRRWLDLIANDGETPQGLRSRAESLQALLPPVAKS